MLTEEGARILTNNLNASTSFREAIENIDKARQGQYVATISANYVAVDSNQATTDPKRKLYSRLVETCRLDNDLLIAKVIMLDMLTYAGISAEKQAEIKNIIDYAPDLNTCQYRLGVQEFLDNLKSIYITLPRETSLKEMKEAIDTESNRVLGALATHHLEQHYVDGIITATKKVNEVINAAESTYSIVPDIEEVLATLIKSGPVSAITPSRIPAGIASSRPRSTPTAAVAAGTSLQLQSTASAHAPKSAFRRIFDALSNTFSSMNGDPTTPSPTAESPAAAPSPSTPPLGQHATLAELPTASTIMATEGQRVSLSESPVPAASAPSPRHSPSAPSPTNFRPISQGRSK